MVSLEDLPEDRSAEATLTHAIDRAKGQVEKVLTRLEMTIHPDLCAHAFRDAPKGPLSGMDRAALPVPTPVRAHPWQGESVWWC